MITWKIEKRNIEDLQGYDKNPRKFTDKGLKDLKKSLQNCGDANIITINADNTVLGGHARLTVMKQLGYTEVDVKVPEKQLTEKQVQEVVVRLNANTAGEWDLDKLQVDFELDELQEWGLDIEFETLEEEKDAKGISLNEKFITSPFSILNAKLGEWQARKRVWLDKGIKSEIGRGTFYDALGKLQRMKNSATENMIKNSVTAETSIFDPVLCEVAYSWFSKENDFIIDPFAGGSVRGIVASELKRNYLGLELRKEQVLANRDNANEICSNYMPVWEIGDSNKILDTIENNKFDMCLSCPPYADLEVYSDDKDDLSNMPYDKFIDIYQSIIKKLFNKLKDDTFVVWVIGEVRNKKGNYYNFVGDTINCFLNAGFNYYNEIILETMLGTAMLRANKTFQAGRKVVKVHQNVLVFVKGDGKQAAKRLGEVKIKEFDMEQIEGE
jgi:DNA modification methylase